MLDTTPTVPSMTQRAVRLGADWQKSASGLYVPAKPKRRFTRPTAVSLFSGAGGMDCGMVQGGWHVVAAVEYDVDAVITYMCNLCRWGQCRMHFIEPSDQARMEKKLKPLQDLMDGKKRGTNRDSTGVLRADLAGIVDGSRVMLAGSGWISREPDDVPGTEHVFIGDVRKLPGERILEAIGMEPGELGCVFGGPPCQGFSSANNRRSTMDPRNSLVFEFTRLVNELNPATLVMENVPGLVNMETPEGIPVIDAICMDLEKGGYGNYAALRNSLAGDVARERGARGAKRGRAGDADTTEEPKPAKQAAQTSLFDEMTTAGGVA